MPRPERRLAKSCSTRANHRPVCPFSPTRHLTSYWSLGTRKIPSRFADSSTCYVYYHGFVGLFFYLLPSPEKLNFLARIRILYMDGRQRTKATKNGWRQPHDTTQPNKTGELSLVRLQSREVFLSWSVLLLSTMHWWWPAKWRKCGPAKRTKIGYWVS